jgi:hypothetical protein
LVSVTGEALKKDLVQRFLNGRTREGGVREGARLGLTAPLREITVSLSARLDRLDDPEADVRKAPQADPLRPPAADEHLLRGNR